MVEAGIKPIFVFDGKAFNMKGDELQRRQELKE
jgi:5'-3' exonuclease